MADVVRNPWAGPSDAARARPGTIGAARTCARPHGVAVLAARHHGATRSPSAASASPLTVDVSLRTRPEPRPEHGSPHVSGPQIDDSRSTTRRQRRVTQGDHRGCARSPGVMSTACPTAVPAASSHPAVTWGRRRRSPSDRRFAGRQTRRDDRLGMSVRTATTNGGANGASAGVPVALPCGGAHDGRAPSRSITAHRGSVGRQGDLGLARRRRTGARRSGWSRRRYDVTRAMPNDVEGQATTKRSAAQTTAGCDSGSLGTAPPLPAAERADRQLPRAAVRVVKRLDGHGLPSASAAKASSEAQTGMFGVMRARRRRRATRVRW